MPSLARLALDLCLDEVPPELVVRGNVGRSCVGRRRPIRLEFVPVDVDLVEERDHDGDEGPQLGEGEVGGLHEHAQHV